MLHTLNSEARKHGILYKSMSTVSNLSEYNFETQTLLKYFLRTSNFFTKFLSKSLLSVKHTKKNYVSRLVVSCLYDYHAILQFKELQFTYTIKEVVHRKCVITNEY